jgi:hypothetical protein
MRVVDAGEILAALDEDAAIAAVETGFKRYSAGQVQVSSIWHSPSLRVTATSRRPRWPAMRCLW